MSEIASRANPRIRRWRALAQDARKRRKERRALIEGEHLVAAFLDSGGSIAELILRKTAAARFSALVDRSGTTPVVLADAAFNSIADAESPGGVAAEIPIPAGNDALGSAPNCVFLEGIQDAGNVGAILRSAAAFGLRHAVLGRGCADAWSPKVLRAGMGAHFSLSIRENADLGAAHAEFGGTVACMLPRGGIALHDAELSGRVGWIFGAEGQGVSEAAAARASVKVTIAMPGSAESLNVAAAAAICFYEFSRRAARS